MSKPIEVGCFAVIEGSMTPADGTLVQVLFDHEPDARGYPIWVISEEFANSSGEMTDRCYEYFLTRVDGGNHELCTDWEDIAFTTGWTPDGLTERA
jgi:hypothetical protein